MAPVEQSIAKQAMRQGQPMPDRIANAPELVIGSELFLTAFFDLDSERSHATAPTAIPWSSILEYAIVYDFDEEQTEDLLFLIKKMDAAHLKRLQDRIKVN